MAENIVSKLSAQRKTFYKLAALKRKIDAIKDLEKRNIEITAAGADWLRLAALDKIQVRVNTLLAGADEDALDKRDCATVLGWEVPNLDKIEGQWGVASVSRTIDGSKLKSWTKGQLRTLLLAQELEELAKKEEYLARADKDDSAERAAEKVIEKMGQLDQDAQDRVAAAAMHVTVEELRKRFGR